MQSFCSSLKLPEENPSPYLIRAFYLVNYYHKVDEKTQLGYTA